MQLQPSGQSVVALHVMSGTQVRVPRLQTLPAPHSVSLRHGAALHVPLTQRSPIAQSASAVQPGTSSQLPSTHRKPAMQSASRPQLPTNTQLPLTHA